MATAAQMKLAVKAFIQEHAPLDDALEHVVESPQLHVQAKQVMEQLSQLLAQARAAEGEPEDVEFCVVALLGFRAALLRSIAISYLNSDNHVFEREGRRERGPEAIRAYEEILSFSNGDYVTANELYQLGWLNRAVGNREQALGYFKQLVERFPDDEHFAGQASLRIVEMESESSSASSSGFRLGGLDIAEEHRAAGGAFWRGSFHLPLQCAQRSAAWLFEQIGLDVSLADIIRALGPVLASNSRIPSAIVHLGAEAYPVSAESVLAGQGDVSLLVVGHGRTSWLTHVVAMTRRSGRWDLYDPGNFQSLLLEDVGSDIARRTLGQATMILKLHGQGSKP